MEGQQAAKRRRVYSVEPNKVVQAAFTRNYMNYLVPALMNIKESRSSSCSTTQHNNNNNNSCDQFQGVVKYEVDMAMVFSAQGFAWSNALKLKLQKGELGNSSRVPLDDFSSKSDQANKILVSNESNHINGMPQVMKKKNSAIGENDDDEDDEVINGQLRSLRRLIPGGEEMCDHEQMVTELESYIRCLQMQVNILQCLAE